MRLIQYVKQLFLELGEEYGRSAFLEWHQAWWADQLSTLESDSGDGGDETCMLPLLLYRRYLQTKLDQHGGDVPYGKWLS